jgi:hypothetical protein
MANGRHEFKVYFKAMEENNYRTILLGKIEHATIARPSFLQKKTQEFHGEIPNVRIDLLAKVREAR